MKIIDSINLNCFQYVKIDNSCYDAIGGVLPRVKITCACVCFFVWVCLGFCNVFHVSEAVLFWFSKKEDVFLTVEKNIINWAFFVRCYISFCLSPKMACVKKNKTMKTQITKN